MGQSMALCHSKRLETHRVGLDPRSQIHVHSLIAVFAPENPALSWITDMPVLPLPSRASVLPDRSVHAWYLGVIDRDMKTPRTEPSQPGLCSSSGLS